MIKNLRFGRVMICCRPLKDFFRLVIVILRWFSAPLAPSHSPSPIDAFARTSLLRPQQQPLHNTHAQHAIYSAQTQQQYVVHKHHRAALTLISFTPFARKLSPPISHPSQSTPQIKMRKPTTDKGLKSAQHLFRFGL